MLYEQAKKLKADAQATERRAWEALQANRSQPLIEQHNRANRNLRIVTQWLFANFKNEAYAERIANKGAASCT